MGVRSGEEEKKWKGQRKRAKRRKVVTNVVAVAAIPTSHQFRQHTYHRNCPHIKYAYLYTLCVYTCSGQS